MKKFEFTSPHEEIEIAGKVYKIDLSDDKTVEYQQKLKKYYDESKEITESNIDSLSEEEQAELLKKQINNMKDITETLLGNGTFNELYEASGRSTANYMKLLLFLGDVMGEKAENVKSEALNHYVSRDNKQQVNRNKKKK
ncbi:MAG TPA: hypothetical protein VNU45_18825 [Rummeliibacillus sp.]|nr:hypothetical protein [Rummeliibacillus sp.]